MTDIPKIELHLHLEGAAPPALVKDKAARAGNDVSQLFDADGAYAYRGFAQFLDLYEAVTRQFETPEDFADLTRAVLSAQADTGVIYAEHFVSPDFCGGRDLGAWRDHLAAIAEAAAGMRDGRGIECRAVVTCIRHFGPDAAREVARCAAETAGPHVTGFGMGGDETAGAARDFAYAFDMAREAGLGLTVHAGEWGGPGHVGAALDALRVSRIGHGVRAIEDPALIDRLARDRVTLEVCPGSNVALGAYETLAAHPVERLRQAGVPVCVSTDDPPFFHTDMKREHAALADTFGWDDQVFREIAGVAARAAFCDDATRDELMKRIAA